MEFRRKGTSVGRRLLDQTSRGVTLAELGLFDLARGIARHVGEDDLAGTLIARQTHAKLVDLLLGAGHALLDLNDGRGNLAQTLVGQADNGNVADLLVGTEEVLDLDRVEVLSARDDNVLFAVYKIDKTILVHAGHVARQEPAVVGQDLIGSGGILVVALHDTVALDRQLAYLTLLNRVAVLVQNAGLPTVARNADGTHLVDVLHAQVDTTGADGLGEAVVGIVSLAGEFLLPTLDQGGGHGLCTNVHEPPLGEAVFIHIELAAVDGVQDILGPRHQEPNDGSALLGNSLEDPLGAHAAEQDRLATSHQGTEPVHLGTRMVEGRDAEENIVPSLAVMGLFSLGGSNQGAVVMENCLGEARGARREVNGGVIVVCQLHGRGDGGAVVDHLIVEGCVDGALGLLAYEEEISDTRQLGEDGIHTAGELGPEDEHPRVSQIEAVFDLIGGVAVVHGNHDRACLEHAKIDGKPLQAVHKQDGHLIPSLDTAGEQEVGEAVSADIEIPPGHLAAVAVAFGGLDEIILTPGRIFFGLIGGVDLHQGDLLGVESGVSFQVFGNGHGEPSFYV